MFLSPMKEPHFFSTDLANRNITTEAAYWRLFEGAGPEHLAVGEASTWYLFSHDAVPSILTIMPEARFIIMTRNPVDMARSLHHHNLRVLHEDEPDFARAWALQAERRAGRHIPPDCTEPAFLQYGAACLLGAQVTRLLRHVPAERLLHIPLEGLSAQPALHYRRVLAFLGAADDKRQDFPNENPARGHRSKLLQRLHRKGARLRLFLGLRRGSGIGRVLRKLNDRKVDKAPLDPTLRADIAAYFAADQKILQESLGSLTDRESIS